MAMDDGGVADDGVLSTARLALVPCTPEIARAVLAGATDTFRLLDASASAGWPGPNFAAYLPTLAADADLGRWAWLIVRPADRAIIGDIGFHGPPDQAGTVELGYVLTPAYWGQGYATEAARTLLAAILARPTVRRVIANCDARNSGSIRVLEKLGLRVRSRIGDELRWELPPPAATTLAVLATKHNEAP